MDKTRWPSYFRGRRATNLVDVDADHEEADAAEVSSRQSPSSMCTSSVR